MMASIFLVVDWLGSHDSELHVGVAALGSCHVRNMGSPGSASPASVQEECHKCHKCLRCQIEEACRPAQ